MQLLRSIHPPDSPIEVMVCQRIHSASEPLYLLDTGRDTLVPVNPDMRMSLLLRNHSPEPVACPIMADQHNLCLNGPDKPSECQNNQMWIVPPHGSTKVSSSICDGANYIPFTVWEAADGSLTLDADGMTVLRVYARPLMTPGGEPAFQMFGSTAQLVATIKLTSRPRAANRLLDAGVAFQSWAWADQPPQVA